MASQQYESPLANLMHEWGKLEPERCGGNWFVKVFDEDGMQCVDEHGEGTLNAKWDEAKIEMGVRSAIESRGWNWNLGTSDNLNNYNAMVIVSKTTQSEISNSVKHSCAAFAILSAYLNTLKTKI